MTVYGYARVSTEDQNLDVQVAALITAGCEMVRAEIRCGSGLEGRDELRTLLDFMRPGDELVVTRIDRLSRSLRDLQNVVYELRAKGITVRATEQPIDTSTAAGAAFFAMVGVFAEFETTLRRERQREGVAAAKSRGVYKGRRPTVPVTEVRRMKSEGIGPADIARRLGIGRASVYRALTMDGR